MPIELLPTPVCDWSPFIDGQGKSYDLVSWSVPAFTELRTLILCHAVANISRPIMHYHFEYTANIFVSLC